MSTGTIRHTIGWDEPWGVELVDPDTGATVAHLRRDNWHAAVEAAVEHARSCEFAGRRLLMTAVAPDSLKLELQEDDAQGRIVGLVARFGSVERMLS